jgi:hypothetical protein
MQIDGYIYGYGECEICGQPANEITLHAMREIAPVKDAKGVWWRCWETVGGAHRRCGAHRRWCEVLPPAPGADLTAR